ncbi:hypothetical protein JTB14_005535 [Gonioctena quinquepunctata]|nr:hypothetical protein JTB14_005535 [Gonioctena quinquepunctata]
MYHYFIINVFIVAAFAKPGNLAVEQNTAEYGLSTGPSIASPGVIGAASLTATASAPVYSAAPTHVAATIQTVPVPTSSQSRVDIINPQPLVQHVVSSIPVNLPAGYLRSSVVGYGSGRGYAGSSSTEAGVGSSLFGAGGYRYGY